MSIQSVAVLPREGRFMRTSRLYVAVMTLSLFAYAPKLTAQACIGLCLQQVSCPNNATTSVTGTVYAPNGADPLQDVLVYVPNGGSSPGYGVQPLLPGVSNPPAVSGNPLVFVNSAADGTFTLTNMPAGANIPLVIQSGKWRRMISIPNVTACTNAPLPASWTSLPETGHQSSPLDNVPAIAIVTGATDTLECSLLQIGIPAVQVSNPGKGGAVSVYLGDLGPGAQIDSNTPTEDSLWSSSLNSYDLILLPDQGLSGDPAANATNQQALINYANNGGRVYASHFSYDWLSNVAPFSGTADWAVDPNSTNHFGNDPGTGLVNTADPRGAALAQWLQLVGASTTYGQIPVDNLHNDFTGVVSPSFAWLSVNDSQLGTVPQLYSFDVPVGASQQQQLGRVFYKDFTGGETGSSQGLIFPNECSVAPPTPEQRLIEYSLFKLTGFLNPPLSQAAQSVGFSTNAPASAAYGSVFTVAASASSNLPVVFSSAGSCTNNGANYTMTGGTGSCSVIANQAGNSVYAAAPQVTETVNATPTGQSISVGVPAPSTATNMSSFTVVASATSGLPLTFASSGACTNSGATYTIIAATGVCTITMTQAGSANYAAASPVSESTTVAKAVKPAVSFTGAPSSATYQSTFAVTATSNSTSTPSITASGSCAVSGTTVTMIWGIGTCSLVAYWPSNDVYAAATARQTTTAVRVPPTVTFAGAPSSSADLSTFTVYTTSNTGIPPTISAAGVCTISGATVTMTKGSGTCSLKATWPANDYYGSATLTQTTMATPLATTTTITSAVAQTNPLIVKVTFTVTGGTAVPVTGQLTVTASTGETCTAAVKTGFCLVKFEAAGPDSLIANYAGDSNDGLSTSAPYPLTVQ